MATFGLVYRLIIRMVVKSYVYMHFEWLELSRGEGI
jgi:hypothetical protein